ncbi:MAG: hydrogenase maturation protease [candidate division Zixibacteria bacterium]|nr:hydrogenase maturation protease [candidate division Zixibacteria bacterium]
MTGVPHLLLIGIGNEFRGDDRVGLEIVRSLKKQAPVFLEVREASGEGATLMEMWKDADAVILVDAVRSGQPPGTIFRLDPNARPIPTKFFSYSTHTFGVAEAVEMARALGRLPGQMIIYGIEGAFFNMGIDLSDEIKKAAGKAAQMILDDVRDITGQMSHRDRHG